MKSKWKEARLDELTELIVDCPHSTPEWTDDGVVVLRNQYIRNGRLDLSAPSFTTEEGYAARIKRAIPTTGDLVLTREAPMGEVCQIPEGLRCCLGQRMVLIRANQDLVDPDFLLYILQSPYLKHQVSWNEGTGTTVSNIRIPNIKAFKIPTPPLDEQKTIAHILGTLDDKIELNRQMNATLEAMAQALFKSWFVDFDPVIDKALAAGNEIPEPLQRRARARQALGEKRKPLPEVVARHFPDRFVFTEEMGWVPEEWEVGTIDSEYNVVMGQSPRGNSYNESGKGTLFFQGRAEFGWRYPTPRLYTIEPKRMANAGDTLMSVRAPVGDFNMALSDCCVGRGLCALRHKSGSSSFTYYQMKDFQKNLDKFNGEGTVFGSINQKDLKAQACLAPAEEVVHAFIGDIERMDSKILCNSNQVLALTKLRNTLLPKLVGGEIII